MDRCPRVAVVEDDPVLLDILARALRTAGFDAAPFPDVTSFVQALSAGETPEVAVLDVRLPDGSGLELLESLGREVPTCRTVMMTAYRTFESVLGSLRMGAVDFLLKPVTATEVVEAVQRSLRLRRAEDGVRESPIDYAQQAATGTVDERLAEIMGGSAAVRGIARFAGKAAAATVPVLLTGETGTGKEVVARAIHEAGPRAHRDMVTLNCGAIPEGLVEAELFGHERGSFTGASERRTGLIEEAHGSSLFLDEVGDLPAVSQVKLLRVLQEGEVRRVGSSRARNVDVRVIAATNRDVETEVKAGRFRHDLFYRLGVLRFRLPPLRERRADIPYLVGRFLRLYGAGDADELPVLSARVMQVLERYPWPGNVRELENEIARIVTLTEGTRIGLEDLSPEIRAVQQVRGAGGLKAALELQERKMIVSCLEETGWNKARAARLLGMSRQNLYQRMDTYEIPRRPPDR
jgi:DNA-binding NtrC family response regulator